MRPPWWARPTAAALFGTGGLWPVRVHGADAVPVTGPALFASNHTGFLDGPMLVAASPRWVQCLVKTEMFHPPLAPLLHSAGQIPVQRDRGDRVALGHALDVLAADGAIGVFPEGTRGRGDVGSVRLGVAWLALRSGAPVVPVACLGARRTGASPHGLPRVRTRLHVVFGTPRVLRPRPGVPGRQALAEAGATVQQWLAAHVAAAVDLTGQPLPDDLGATAEENARGEQP